MPEFDLVVKDGTIFDGRGTPRVRGDIGVKDGVIAEIGRLRSSDAARVVDASGCNVAPGFIDLHTHYDSQVFWDSYCSPAGWHGVTTVTIGDCGFGFAPVRPEFRERSMLTLTRNEAVPLHCMQAGMPWDWVTFPELLDSLDARPKSVNLHVLQALSPVLIWAMGFERAKAGEMPTDEEHATMRQLLDDAMRAGAAGFSTQRSGWNSIQRDYDGTPMVTDVMHDETMIELGKVLADHNYGYIQYTIVEPERIGEVVDGQLLTSLSPQTKAHIEELARVCGRPIVTLGDMDWLAACRRQGLPIYLQGGAAPPPRGDRFDIVFSFADEFSAVNTSAVWVEIWFGDVEDRMVRIQDPAWQQRAREDTRLGRVLGDLDDWIIQAGKHPDVAMFDGMSLYDVGLKLGKDSFDSLMELVIKDKLQTRIAAPLTIRNSSIASAKEIADRDIWGLPVGSDGGAHTKYAAGAHPATTYLQRVVRDLAWTTLEDAHWRLGLMHAHAASLRDGRGTLVEGAPADIIVYDFDELETLPSEIVTDYPNGEWRRVSRTRGMRAVVCNGGVTIENDYETGEVPGVVLRSGRRQKR